MPFLPTHFELPTRSGAPASTLFLLHGIFGSGRNWRTFATDLAGALPSHRIVVVDLRNHGNSLGAPPPHTLAASANDLVALGEHLGVTPDVVIGHSFGGKVALAYARRAPSLRTLISLDSPPGPGSSAERVPHATEAGRVLLALRTLPMPTKSRADVAKAMEGLGVQAGVAAWMATNLRARPDGQYAWHFDVEALAAMLDDYWAYDGWPQLESPRDGLAIHFVRAANSDRFTSAEITRLDELARRGTIASHVLGDAGHWLHVDNPKGLLAMLTSILEERAI
ncbi:MAG: alpha/beta hydrolase [Planctomycetes bacterium]|nr:alpha/beta hydrolase [Planctomycetota bacterium]MCC7170192.1 alpha/beta hydrolase [Planctomycetota bacterium]